MAGTGLGQSWGPGTQSRSPMWRTHTQLLEESPVICQCLPWQSTGIMSQTRNLTQTLPCRMRAFQSASKLLGHPPPCGYFYSCCPQTIVSKKASLALHFPASFPNCLIVRSHDPDTATSLFLLSFHRLCFSAFWNQPKLNVPYFIPVNHCPLPCFPKSKKFTFAVYTQESSC